MNMMYNVSCGRVTFPYAQVVTKQLLIAQVTVKFKHMIDAKSADGSWIPNFCLEQVI